VAVVLSLVHLKNGINRHKLNNNKRPCKTNNAVNTSTHITKTTKHTHALKTFYRIKLQVKTNILQGKI